ncbi:MAG: LysR family transcriptional regulator [Bacteroidota bacterium]
MLSISQSQIKYVLAVERTGSFSEAAETCHVTQSTLSTMVKKLENQIGIQLFDRTVKPIELSPEGQQIIDQFRVLHNEYENLTELVQETRNQLEGVLKIGVIPTLAPFLLPLFLGRFMSKHTELQFNISEITTNEILKRLRLRELDIGVLSLPIDDPDFEETSLFQEDFLVYDARQQESDKKTYQIKDIDLSRLWLLEESHCLTSQIGKICNLKAAHQSHEKLVFNSGSILSLLELVNINRGITLLPRLATLQKNIIEPSWLHPLAKPVPARDVGLVTHKSFSKRRLFKMLKEDITSAVQPFLSDQGQVDLIAPF